MWLSGGAVMVQVPKEQEKAGKIVLEPKLFPWVLETMPIKDILILD